MNFGGSIFTSIFSGGDFWISFFNTPSLSFLIWELVGFLGP